MVFVTYDVISIGIIQYHGVAWLFKATFIWNDDYACSKTLKQFNKWIQPIYILRLENGLAKELINNYVNWCLSL